MKDRVILGINIVIVIGLVAASAYQANQWRTEGTAYSAKRKADGEIARNVMVAKGKGQADVIRSGHTAPAERDRAAMVAAATASGKGLEAKADTQRVIDMTAATRAQADAVRSIQPNSSTHRGFEGSGPKPNAFAPIAPSVIDEGPSEKPNAFASRPGVAPSVMDEGKPSRGFQRATDPNDPFEAVGRGGKPTRGVQPAVDPKDPFSEVGKPKKDPLDKYKYGIDEGKRKKDPLAKY